MLKLTITTIIVIGQYGYAIIYLEAKSARRIIHQDNFSQSHAQNPQIFNVNLIGSLIAMLSIQTQIKILRAQQFNCLVSVCLL